MRTQSSLISAEQYDAARENKVKGVVKGAIQIMATKTYRQRYEHSTGRDPCVCPHCQNEMGLWRIWHPTYGVIHDELEVHLSTGPHTIESCAAMRQEEARR